MSPLPSVGKFSLTLVETELVAKKKAKRVKCVLNSRKKRGGRGAGRRKKKKDFLQPVDFAI